MVLTGSRNPNNHSFPTFQLFVLAICRIAEPIALTSIFPYAYPMVKQFLGEDNDNAALYTGILISSFSLAEALTGMHWGGLSDRIGRKPVLLLGCTGTLISILMTGFARSFWFALLARLLGGLLNGNIGVLQTMVGELVRNPEHERKIPFPVFAVPWANLTARAFAVMPFVWSIGSICGPAISGLTVNSPLFPSLPYLLPNLICAGILLLGILVAYFFLEETLSEDQPVNFNDKDEGITTALMATSGGNDAPDADLRSESYGTFNHVQVTQSQTWTVNSNGSSPETSHKSIFSRRIVLLMAGLAIYLYHTMAYDSLLPIFLQDPPSHSHASPHDSPLTVGGGLGLKTQQVGIIMSVNGLIALFIQGIIFPLLTDCLGVWRTFQIITLLHPIVYLVVPFLAMIPQSWVFPGTYACLIVRNIFLIPAYPLFLILIKEAGNTRYLGKINGLAASVGAVARCASPPVAGWLYVQGTRMNFTGLAWWGTGLVAIVGSVQLFWIRRQKNVSSTVRRPCAPLAEDVRKEVVHIVVAEVDSETEGEVEV